MLCEQLKLIIQMVNFLSIVRYIKNSYYRLFQYALFLYSNFHFFIDFTVLKRYRYSSIEKFISDLFFRLVNDLVDSQITKLHGWRMGWSTLRISVPPVIKNLRKSRYNHQLIQLFCLILFCV